MIPSWMVDDIERAFELPKFKNFKEFLHKGFNLNKEDVLSTFKIEFSPWLNTVADWLDDSETEWINLAQATQTAKTTLPMAFLIYAAQREPVRFLWTQSTEEEAKQFITDRLRPYIEDYSSDAISRNSWRIEAFKVFKARVKIGFASNEQSLRQTPAKYVVGDECSIWKASISTVKKRTRTFEGRGRKGIFVTTPPKDPNHHSWKEFCQANFYRWYVECPECKESQPLVMPNLKFDGRDGKGWDYARVRESTRYQCRRCKSLWHNDQKLSIINSGRAVCVDPENGYKEKAEQKGNTAKTLQISALYSVFTHWGETACNFLRAKHAGGDEFKTFVTDELAEAPIDLGSTESLQESVLSKFVDGNRRSGFSAGYDIYTAGVDVQRNGELYCSIYGWRAGVIPTGHLLSSCCVSWQGGNFQQKWANLLLYFALYQPHLSRVAIDSTDGLVRQDIYDFCNNAGRPYIALVDSTTLHLKTCIKTIIPEVNGKKISSRPQLVIIANSDKIKDDIASSFQRTHGDVGAWSFPSDTQPEYLKSLTTEHRTTDKKGKSSWGLKYAHAPNHYFSSLVYACAAMEEFRVILQSGLKKVTEQLPAKPRVASGGINIWR